MKAMASVQSYLWKIKKKKQVFSEFLWYGSEHGCIRKPDTTDKQYSPQRHDPSSCCTSSSFVWHWKHRRLLFCLDRLVSSGLSLLSSSSRGRFSGEASLSDCESVVFTTNILGKILELPCWGIPLGRLKVQSLQLGSPPSSKILPILLHVPICLTIKMRIKWKTNYLCPL